MNQPLGSGDHDPLRAVVFALVVISALAVVLEVLQ